jgi:RNA polymerase sigma factor (sigma-70 family)
MDADAEQLEALARVYEHRVGFFARKIAREYLIGTRWNDELMSAGYWGLAVALRRRRPDASERELSAYVSTRIAGAVIDAARVCITRSRRCELMPSPLADVAPAEGESPGGARFAGMPGDGSDNPEARASARRIQQVIETALERLEPGQRRMVCSYMRGASLREIADADGVPLGTLRVRFEKAIRLLRAMLPELRRARSCAGILP